MSTQVVDNGNGTSTIIFPDGSTLVVSGDASTVSTNLILGTSADDVGNMKLKGFKPDEFMFGFAGDDRLEGKDGNDVMDGGAGADIVLGAKGNDTLIHDLEENTAYAPGTFDYYDGGGDIDTLVIDLTYLSTIPPIYNSLAEYRAALIQYFETQSALGNTIVDFQQFNGGLDGSFALEARNFELIQVWTPPVAEDVDYTGGIVEVNEDDSAAPFYLTFSDPDGDTPIVDQVTIDGITYFIPSDNPIFTAQGGILIVDPNGTFNGTSFDGMFTYDPNGAFESLAEGESAFETFTYRIIDDDGGTDTGTVTIEITGVNDNPTANDVLANADEDGPIVTASFDADDIDSDDDPTTLSYALLSQPTEGSVSLGAVNGTYDFDPGADFQNLALNEKRDVTFDYQVTDAHGATASAMATITVTGVNDDPTANDVVAAAFEDGPTVNANFDADDIDSDNDPTNLTYSLLSQPSEGSVSLGAVNGTYDFNPGANFQDLALNEKRDVTFDYQVTDAHGATASAMATITVTGVNDDPTANDVVATADEDGQVVNASFDADDIDSDNDPTNLTYSLLSQPSEGSVSLGAVNGTYDFDPGAAFQDLALNEKRDVTFNYQVTDAHGATASAMATITVTGANDAPEWFAPSTTAEYTEDDVTQATFSSITSQVFDPDLIDTLSVAVTPKTVLNGSTLDAQIVSLGNGNYLVEYTYTANVNNTNYQSLYEGQVSQDSFTAVVDDVISTASQIVDIVLIGANDAPTANNATRYANEDGNLVIVDLTTLANDIDYDDGSDTLLYEIIGPPSEGSATIVNSNQLEFDPGDDFQDLAKDELRFVDITYQVTDKHNATATGIVTMQVTGVNDAPVARDDNFSIDQNTVLNGNVFADNGNGTDFDIDNGSSFFINTSSIPNALLNNIVLFGTTGDLIFDPLDDFQNLGEGQSTQVSLSYDLIDNLNSASNTATITIHIAGVNDPIGPVTDEDPSNNAIGEISGTAGTPVGITALAIDVDDNDSVSYTVDDARFDIDANGVITYNGSGPLDFETEPTIDILVTASSTDTTQSQATFTINVLDEIEQLFTDDNDTVDFTNNSVFVGTYPDGTQYDALNGNDTITLPYLATVTDANGTITATDYFAATGYLPGTNFSAGDGDDTINLIASITGNSGALGINGDTAAIVFDQIPEINGGDGADIYNVTINTTGGDGGNTEFGGSPTGDGGAATSTISNVILDFGTNSQALTTSTASISISATGGNGGDSETTSPDGDGGSATTHFDNMTVLGDSFDNLVAINLSSNAGDGGDGGSQGNPGEGALATTTFNNSNINGNGGTDTVDITLTAIGGIGGLGNAQNGGGGGGGTVSMNTASVDNVSDISVTLTATGGAGGNSNLGNGNSGANASAIITSSQFTTVNLLDINVIANAGNGGNAISLAQGDGGNGGSATAIFTNNTITGTSGNDVVDIFIQAAGGTGGSANAGVDGAQGSATISFNNNSVDLGDGDDDELRLNRIGNNTYQGGVGIGDHLNFFSVTTVVALDLINNTVATGAENSTISGFEVFTLSDSVGDTVTFGDNSESLSAITINNFDADGADHDVLDLRDVDGLSVGAINGSFATFSDFKNALINDITGVIDLSGFNANNVTLANMDAILFANLDETDILLNLSPLFTNGNNVVNFNDGSFVAGDYLEGTQYNALNGDDIVTLPVTIAAANATGFALGSSFTGGDGMDEINLELIATGVAGDASDVVALIDNTIVGSIAAGNGEGDVINLSVEATGSSVLGGITPTGGSSALAEISDLTIDLTGTGTDTVNIDAMAQGTFAPSQGGARPANINMTNIIINGGGNDIDNVIIGGASANGLDATGSSGASGAPTQTAGGKGASSSISIDSWFVDYLQTSTGDSTFSLVATATGGTGGLGGVTSGAFGLSGGDGGDASLVASNLIILQNDGSNTLTIDLNSIGGAGGAGGNGSFTNGAIGSLGASQLEFTNNELNTGAANDTVTLLLNQIGSSLVTINQSNSFVLGSGQDTLIVNQVGTGSGGILGTSNRYQGGSDNDLIDYGLVNANLTIDQSIFTDFGAPIYLVNVSENGGGTDVVIDFESLTLGAGDDTVIVGTGDQALTLNGFSGNDVIDLTNLSLTIGIGGDYANFADFAAANISTVSGQQVLDFADFDPTNSIGDLTFDATTPTLAMQDFVFNLPTFNDFIAVAYLDVDPLDNTGFTPGIDIVYAAIVDENTNGVLDEVIDTMWTAYFPGSTNEDGTTLINSLNTANGVVIDGANDATSTSIHVQTIQGGQFEFESGVVEVYAEGFMGDLQTQIHDSTLGKINGDPLDYIEVEPSSPGIPESSVAANSTVQPGNDSFFDVEIFI